MSSTNEYFYMIVHRWNTFINISRFNSLRLIYTNNNRVEIACVICDSHVASSPGSLR